MNVETINSLDKVEAKQFFLQCCTSGNWAEEMSDSRPYTDRQHIIQKATAVWLKMKESDYLEAFDGHPKIGDPDSLKNKYRNTQHLATGEQSGMRMATDEVIEKLSLLNSQYLEKFGFIFIVCATGKKSEEMLEMIQSRINNDRDVEISIAAGEQDKITRIRIDNLITP